jgi:hypothetical protein
MSIAILGVAPGILHCRRRGWGRAWPVLEFRRYDAEFEKDNSDTSPQQAWDVALTKYAD